MQTDKFTRHDAIALLSLGIASIAIHWRFFLGEDILGHDVMWHTLWINHFSQHIQDGVIYPRWLAETNYGYGSPTFVFYPPLPYYFAFLFKGLANWSMNWTFAGVYSLTSFLSGLGMYGYRRRAWGRFAALMAGLLFLLAPVCFVDRYARAALSAAVATMWLPWGLWLTDAAATHPRARWGVAGVSAGLTISNLPALLLFVLLWVPYAVATQWRRGWRTLLATLASIGFGWGLVGTYIIPAAFERHLVRIDESIPSVAGGVLLNLIGASNPNGFVNNAAKIWTVDVVCFVVALCAAVAICAKRKQGWSVSGQMALAFGLLIFLTHRVSAPIWANISLLEYVQFPWRLLPVMSLLVAWAIGYVLSFAKMQPRWLGAAALCVGLGLLALRSAVGVAVALDAASIQNNTKADRYNPEVVERIELAAQRPLVPALEDVPEYRPAQTSPPIPNEPLISFSGSAELERWTPNDRAVTTEATAPSTLAFRLYCYPAWKLELDGQPQNLNCSPDGTIEVEVPSGKHRVSLHYGWTTASRSGAVVAVASTLAMFVLSSSTNRDISQKRPDEA
ncbi:MAG: hypothetical protein ACFB9N_03055 [Geitlerinemataceae cyanobacterium]